MTKIIKFAIRTKVDDTKIRRRTEKAKNENILFSYGDLERVNPLDCQDHSNMFASMSKRIASDWTKIDSTNILGTSYTFTIIENQQICSLVNDVLLKKFDDQFIKSYDRKNHEFVFTIKEDGEYTVEEPDKLYLIQDFSEETEASISFALSVVSYTSKQSGLEVIYVDVTEIPHSISKDELSFYNIASRIIRDYYLMQLYKSSDYTLSFHYDWKFNTAFEKILEKLLLDNFLFEAKNTGTYLVELSIKDNKLQALSIAEKEGLVKKPFTGVKAYVDYQFSIPLSKLSLASREFNTSSLGKSISNILKNNETD